MTVIGVTCASSYRERERVVSRKFARGVVVVSNTAPICALEASVLVAGSSVVHVVV